MDKWYKKPLNILIIVIILIGLGLIYNTWPHESKAIKELINAIENSIKENTKTNSSNHKLIENKKVEQYSTDSDKFDSTGLPLVKMEETVVETSKEGVTPEFYTIKLSDFENALKAVALVSRQEAAEDYHKSFSILVTILTLFGIGFPVLVALIQFRFSERHLDDIKNAVVKAEESTKQANEAGKLAELATTQAQGAIQQANNAQNNANNALNKNNELNMFFCNIKIKFYIEMYETFNVFSLMFDQNNDEKNKTLMDICCIYYLIMALQDVFSEEKQKSNQISQAVLNNFQSRIPKLSSVLGFLNKSLNKFNKNELKQHFNILEKLYEMREIMVYFEKIVDNELIKTEVKELNEKVSELIKTIS